MTSKVSTAPNSRPVHPCYLSVWEGNSGSECSTWANITGGNLPDLVTAQASTLNIYSIEESTGKLLLAHSFPNLAGSVCYLGTLATASENEHEPDSLLVAFSGHPRLAVVSVKPANRSTISPSPKVLLATSLLDLTPALTENSFGSATPLEQDLMAHLMQKKNIVTLSIILGGGVSVVCVTLRHHNTSGWIASEPYLLPLQLLSRSLKLVGDNKSKTTTASGGNAAGATAAAKDLASSIVTGFGDMVCTAFLPGYLEPTCILLHSNPLVGKTWSGRLGRPMGSDGGTRYGLIVTAISVTVTHQRSAVLWSVEVPADAQSLHAVGDKAGGGCLVVCTNSIVAIDSSGKIRQCLAVNGWVRSTLTTRLLEMVQPNPWPFPKMSIQLDGAKLSVINDTTAFLVLRCGQLYILQYSNAWCLLPLYHTIGAAGQVANLICHSFQEVPKNSLYNTLWDAKDTTKAAENIQMGLMFAGSRLGDASLLGFSMESTSIADAIKHEQAMRDKSFVGPKKEAILTSGLAHEQSSSPSESDDYDMVLRLEEEALYASTGADIEGPNVIPPSDDEVDEFLETAVSASTRRKRARLSQLVVVRSLTALDSLASLGPLGPGCEGPLSKAPQIMKTDGTATPSLGASAYVFPCGYGSSGGLALLTAPGRDDRSVVAEEDCINVGAIFSLSKRGLVLLSMGPADGGTRILQLEKTGRKKNNYGKRPGSIGGMDNNADYALAEVGMDDWCSGGHKNNPRSLIANSTLLGAAEFEHDNSFVFVLTSQIDDITNCYSIVGLTEESDAKKSGRHLVIKYGSQLSVPNGSAILTITPLMQQKGSLEESVSFAYTVSSGDATLVTVDSSGSVRLFDINATQPMHIDDLDDDDDNLSSEEKLYYKSGIVVAVDLFVAPKKLFLSPSADTASRTKDVVKDEQLPNDEHKQEEADVLVLDEDDIELYGESETKTSSATSQTPVSHTLSDSPISDEETLFLAVCRQSGRLEIYVVSDFTSGQEATPVWTSPACGHGVPKLQTQRDDEAPYRTPRMHLVYTHEMRFFFCGPSSPEWNNSLARVRPFCLAVETSDGDTLLYSAELNRQTHALECFNRIPLKLVTRQSQEQTRHFAKLRRKGIVGKIDAIESQNTFQRNRLFRFKRVSGQDGLFAAVARPIWIIAERGRPTVLCHRSRHVAPAGGRPRPVSGFCSGLMTRMKSGGSGFMTLHERVGRVGSQRLTMFSGILDLFNAHGLLPGGGLFVEKIHLGVTVRRIDFIDDSSTSSGAHPLYSVLVSRELEEDLSNLNDDGLSQEERQQMRDEKENAKIKRQVEADLGGFDIEQEWVEEIEREDCFKVDTNLGGAPPVPKRAYSLWIVDAANGWIVVDSYELGEFEHATTMKVMSLTEFAAEPGSANADDIAEEDMGNKLFIAVGTGMVDKDGEDVSSKGRVLLFDLKRADDRSLIATSQIAELSLVYEKDIFHGPVTSLSCLTSEGKNRLVIGAGADVNVEQWGNEKLTQVGFFRATMHVLDITLFKNFFLLSDAYDSLYFLVWRESDKSLTLLAKDYDPIPVYAAGLMSRGGSLSLVCHDDRQNLQFFQYAPGDAAARGGNKLVCRADFHLGSQTIALQSHFCRSSLLINSATPSSTLAALKQQDTFFGRTDDDQRLAIHFGTTDGGYGTVIPLSEPVYWRLTALQSVMDNALESDCALSHRAWRMYRRTPRRGGCRSNDRKKGVIDGDLVIQFADLAVADQEDLASAIGSTVELILDNLLELRCAAMVI